MKFILESKKFLDSLPLQFKETLQKYIYYNNKYKSENLNEEESINPLASPSAGAPALNYGDVNTETTSPGEVKGLINIINHSF